MHSTVLIASLVLLSPILFVVALATCANHPLAAKRMFFGILGFALVLVGGKAASGHHIQKVGFLRECSSPSAQLLGMDASGILIARDMATIV
jgi:hypothetical protein